MKLNSYKITYKHTEGNGIFAVATGRPSGTYVADMHGHADESEARQCFEATHRHGDVILSVEQVAHA